VSENVDPSAVWRLVDESVAALPASDRLAVRTAVANSVLEGWQPTKVDVDRLAAFALGAITMEQYRAWVLRDCGHAER
jgi:hypothetical protein